MNDYVIINGVNSNTISGLKISKLPPITKPQMRALIETIDGRDGDLITDLGYSAYDKQLEIGLWGTYDINEIISFFNQEGTITFSNEADKFYNFKIINQIDYAKLLKFKTAVVVMHCQPFKYPTSETPIEGTPTTITEEGESLTLNNTLEAPLEIDLKGNAYQNGTPTPDTPIDIQVVSGDNTIKVEGKNKFNVADISQTTDSRGLTYKVENNVFTISGTNTSTSSYALLSWLVGGSTVNYFNTIFEKGKTYTLSANNNLGGLYFQINYFKEGSSSQSQLVNLSSLSGKATFTIPQDYDRVGNIFLGVYGNATTGNGSFSMQLEEGSAKTDFQPYQSQSYPINLGEIELCKIGEYQDYIYKDSGKWYLHKEIGKVILNGSESWFRATRSDNTTHFYQTSLSSLNLGNTTIENELSNYFVLGNPYSSTGNNFWLYKSGTTEIARIGFSNETIDTADKFKTWLSTYNTIVYYVLETPTTTEITDSTLLNQLNALEGANSYDNQTNVSQVNNDYPFWLSVSTTFNAPITINNIGNIYAKPILELEGSGNITINLNSQDILAISLGDTTTKIVLDIPNLEAYNPTDSTLMNRLVVGDYMKLLINSGNNTLKIDGTITSYRLTSFTRWI